MAFLLPLGAGVASSAIRVYERFQPISNDAERYLEREINFEKATDNIVKNIRIYLPLTTTKIVCDAIVLGVTGRWIYDVLIQIRLIFKGLFNCGLTAFISGIKLSFEKFLMSLQNCTVSLILTQFVNLFDRQKKFIASISIWDFCNICNQIYFLIIALTNDFKKTIQLELVKYWLECMGIIRAIAESHNINFIKYMNRSCSRRM
jgi:hypothetical protein